MTDIGTPLITNRCEMNSIITRTKEYTIKDLQDFQELLDVMWEWKWIHESDYGDARTAIDRMISDLDVAEGEQR